MKRAIAKHAGHFAAVIGLALIAVVVGGYILANQRLRFPWEGKPFELQAAFTTAQAVTPGQGQTVRVSGVRVGDITKVALKDGHAMVTMSLDPRVQGPRPHRRDRAAAAQDRPEGHVHRARPGHRSAPLAKAGGRCRSSNTLPDVNPDEILASLDSDTRDYLKLLVNGAGQGLKGRGDDLQEVFPRFEPTYRDLGARQLAGRLAPPQPAPPGALAARLNDELASKSDDLAALVDSSSARCSAPSPPSRPTSRGRSATCPPRCADDRHAGARGALRRRAPPGGRAPAARRCAR